MKDGGQVTAINGKFMAEIYERGADGSQMYRSTSFRKEADAWAWVRQQDAAAAVAATAPGPTFPVYEITQTETGTYRVTIAGFGLSKAESLGEFSNSEHAQTSIRRMETLDRGKTTRASDLPAP